MRWSVPLLAALLLPLGASVGTVAVEQEPAEAATCQQQSLLQIKSGRRKEGPPDVWASGRRSTAARSCPLPLGARWCEVRLKNLPVFSIATRLENDVVSWKLCDLGFWEEDDMSQFGKPGHLLDIGANLGYFTFAFAHAGWKVTAFEPMRDNLALMNASLCRNPDLASRIKVNAIGLGPKSTDCAMVSPSKNMGDGFSLCNDDDLDGTAPIAPKVVLSNRKDFKFVGSYPMRRLDEVLVEQGITSVDAVKIDVEGHELAVFTGAGEFLRKFKPRIVKSEVWGEMSGGASGETYLNMFLQAGYGFFKDSRCSDQIDALDTMKNHGMVDVYMCPLARPLSPW